MESNIYNTELTDIQKLKLTNEILEDGFVNLSIKYAKLYKLYPKTFLNCYLNFNSFRLSCSWIVWSYKRVKAYNELTDKDFSDWCSKQNLNDKEKLILNDTLRIIYSLNNN